MYLVSICMTRRSNLLKLNTGKEVFIIGNYFDLPLKKRNYMALSEVEDGDSSIKF